MAFCAPWSDPCLHNWNNPTNLGQLTLVDILSTNEMCALKQFKTLTELNVPNNIYKSIYMESPASYVANFFLNNNKE